MNTFSKISLLLTASAALFLPACGSGGGGENRDYYVSVQRFRGGAKGFHIAGSPSAEVFAIASGVNGHNYALSEKFMDIVSLGEREDENDGESVYAQGIFNCAGSKDSVEVGYYTAGGTSGQGYLYVSFQGSSGPSSNVAHFLGANSPEDVKIAGLPGTASNYWIISDVSQLLIVSLQGAVLKMGFDFSSGIADVRLVYTSATTAQRFMDMMSEPGMTYQTALDTLMRESDQIIAIRATPFFAVDG